MRKILISLLIVLLLVVAYLTAFKGINILGMEVLSIYQIKDKNSNLEKKLENVSALTSIEQPKAMSSLNNSLKELIIAKEEYNDKVLYSSSENIAEAAQTIPYETEYLWTRLGNHAKKNGINLKYELKQTATSTIEKQTAKQYDLHFTLTGSYVSISEFIAAIENDSSLNFKIEDFRLNPTKESTETLEAQFVVKEISVKTDNVTKTNSSVPDTDKKNTNS
ncbi:MAG: hypothetical protein HFJ57_05725 [Clostridia bacterium]|nr:hypothetical protein [Clostridia bacterium]